MGGGFLNSKKSSAEVLPSVVKPKKAVMCHMEEIRMLGKLHPGLSYSAAGHKFSVSESAMYIKDVFKQKCT